MSKKQKNNALAIVAENVTEVMTLDQTTVDFKSLESILNFHPEVEFITKAFPKSFFASPSIQELSSYGFETLEKFKYGIFAENKLLQIPGEEFPKVIDNKMYYLACAVALIKHFGLENLDFQFEIDDDYSGIMRVGIKTLSKELKKGDIVYPAIEMKNSYTGIFKSGANFSFSRVWCSNGAMRKEVIPFEDITEILLTQGNVFAQLIESNNAIEAAKIDTMVQKIIPASLVEKKISPAICAIGFQKKMLEDAHFTMHDEAEKMETPLNAWLIYNGFNKTLFDRRDTSLTRDAKMRIDNKIFEYLYGFEN